jgi:hypothetical protein
VPATSTQKEGERPPGPGKGLVVKMVGCIAGKQKARRPSSGCGGLRAEND